MATTVRRDAGQAWLATLLGVLVLVAGGFALGLIVGVVSQEPELVVGHVAGRGTEIAWSADRPAATQHAASAEVGRQRPDPRPALDTVPQAGTLAAGQRTAQAASHSVAKAVSQPTVRPVSAPPPTGGRYAVQVGAFAAASAADEVADGLRSRGYPVYVVASSEDGRLRVRVGPVADRAEADRTANRLKVEEKLPTWVLRERGD